ncbi:MAG TPA: hypothetical protein VMN82_17790 [Thermoanaerobaculia bacterium]|nr:hypothetical protein [Thermoanaerobaculia bacterium]
MRLPFLAPVVPPHVFCLLDEGVTYARVRDAAPEGFVEARHFRYPTSSLGGPSGGVPLVTREAVAEAVKAARALAGGRLQRASVVYPDAWARILPVELEAMPADAQAGADMVLWKLKKLVPQLPPDVAVVYAPMPVLSDEKRVLAAATPRAALEAIEHAFDELGVRVGYLAPSSLALFEGLAPALSAAAGGDYALLHRSGGALAFFIARGAEPIFFRQRPPGAAEDQEQEARLSLSYYAERLKGPGLRAVYLHDEAPEGDLAAVSAFPVRPVPVTGRLVGGDADFDERLKVRPELLAAYAAGRGRA